MSDNTRPQDDSRDTGRPQNDDDSLMTDEELESVAGGCAQGDTWGPKMTSTKIPTTDDFTY